MSTIDLRPYVIGLLAGCGAEKSSRFTEAPFQSSPENTLEIVEQWNLALQSQVDIIVFGDTSGSMQTELITLGEEMSGFLEQLALYTDNWQLIAVTGPDGCGVGGVIEPMTPNYIDLFAQGIITPPGEDLVDEWGLYNVQQAIDKSVFGQCNEGFLREKSRLHVIFISDEEDNSPGWDGHEEYWRNYYEDILLRKKDRTKLIFSGIIGPPEGCYDVEPGNGYSQLIAESGGESLSICDPWQQDINRLVEATVAYPIFTLSETPIVDTIDVHINAVYRAHDWGYNPEQNTIVFYDDPPKLGDEVRVVYSYLPPEAE